MIFDYSPLSLSVSLFTCDGLPERLLRDDDGVFDGERTLLSGLAGDLLGVMRDGLNVLLALFEDVAPAGLAMCSVDEFPDLLFTDVTGELIILEEGRESSSMDGLKPKRKQGWKIDCIFTFVVIPTRTQRKRLLRPAVRVLVG